MPLFHRSSEKKQRSHRFSFRRHSHEPSEPVKAAPAVAAAASSATTTRPQPAPSASYPQRFPAPQAPPKDSKGAGSSITSEAATSVASSLRSSSSLSFVERHSGGTSGGAATAAETSSSSESESDAGAESLLARPLTKASASRSISSSSSTSSQSMRNSLADYRQLRCSMSYKNRVQATEASFRNTTLHAPAAASDSHASDLRSTELSARISEAGRSDGSESRESSLLASVADTSGRSSEPVRTSGAEPAASSDVRMTEANVAAMQTRRALQQMVLSLEDEDSDNEYESESEFVRSSSSESAGGVLQVSADDYRKFQFRLRQLEDLCNEQARKQASMEETIEREVRDRTRKVVEAMEKNIAMYKQAKELECEREIQKRVSELDAAARGSTPSARESATLRSSARESSEKGKPLEKLFHPRRARRRLELLREREEQQKREMEQFREFIRSTEVTTAATPMANSASVAPTKSSAAAAAALKELGDPHLTEALLQSSHEELIETVCILRKHVSVQEAQLNEAKSLISAAIEAREEAEETAREAVELTLQLDSRLERASQEIVFIRDELRESQLHARSLSPRSFGSRASSVRLGPDRRRSSSGLHQPVTPSSSC